MYHSASLVKLGWASEFLTTTVSSLVVLVTTVSALFCFGLNMKLEQAHDCSAFLIEL